MGVAFLDKKGGGSNLTALIEDYYVYAGENISAGDFVQFVNGIASSTTETSTTTRLSSTAQTGYCTSAVQLDENRVFIAHNYGTSYYLRGIVVTIENSTITAGTDTALSTTTNAGKVISATLLPNGNVFIAHCYDSSYYLYGIVCSIDGTTISKGTDTKILGDTNAGYVISAKTLSDGKVLISHSITSNYKLCGIVCTISNKTITVGTDTALSSTSYSGKAISTVLLESGNVFIAHDYDTTDQLRGMVCSVSGTTISAGSDTALVSSSMAGYAISTTLLSSGKVLVAHSRENTPLYAMVVTVNNKSISKGSDTSLVSTSEASFKLSAVGLPNEKAFISHYGGDEGYLNGIVLTISGTTITKGTDTQLDTANYSSCGMSTLLLPSGFVLVSHGSGDNSQLYAQVFGIDDTNNIPTNNIVMSEYETQVKVAYDPPFNGIAKTKGTGGTNTAHGEQIKVLSPNLVYQMTDFKDTSVFNVAQHSTKTLVKEETPVSSSFIRLGKTEYEYPSNGFTLKDKPELQFDGNVVAVVVYKYTSDTTNLPRVGWYTEASGYGCWNVTSASFWNGFPKKDGWNVHRVKYDRTNYNKVREAGCFGICQLLVSDNIVLDIAGIWFYKVTDEQYNNDYFINKLGPVI